MDNSRKERVEKVSIFAQNLARLRKRMGLTTAELAYAIDKSVSHTNNLLNGTRAPSVKYQWYLEYITNPL